jgi:hypothetical protein
MEATYCAQAAFRNKWSQFPEQLLSGDICSRRSAAGGLPFLRPRRYGARLNLGNTGKRRVYG